MEDCEVGSYHHRHLEGDCSNRRDHFDLVREGDTNYGYRRADFRSTWAVVPEEAEVDATCCRGVFDVVDGSCTVDESKRF